MPQLTAPPIRCQPGDYQDGLLVRQTAALNLELRMATIIETAHIDAPLMRRRGSRQ